ncbi:unnamed protein product [Lactuca saligna]|uniref:Cytochrome oxidase subunit I profile domain-containing protein n=1 Tax=Lactuca saligna TaxID=75948 RepID=A0AA35VH77_LACSI|nr:unnamed protein product [Lactuca saligna]
MGNLSLYIAREPPSTSLATVLVAQNKRIGPSLADRSRVELALLPRLSLTRLSRTQSLGGSFLLHSLAITRRERSNQGLSGMPRRIPDYPDAYAGWNALSSSGSYISVVGICRFFVVVTITSSSGNNKRCAPSPWAVEQNPTTPEWMVQSPPAFHTFGELPAIKETKSSVKCKGSGGLLGLRRYLWKRGYKKRDTICCSNCSGKCCTVVEQGMQRAEVMKKGPGLGIPSSKVRSHGARRPFDDPTSDVIPFCSLPVEYPNYSISNSGMDHERFCLEMPIRNSQL